jgi:hypothetical protein
MSYVLNVAEEVIKSESMDFIEAMERKDSFNLL